MANRTGNIVIVGLFIAAGVIISSCSDNNSGGGVDPTSFNVAQAAGVSVTSNINTGGAETYVNDGDSSTTNSWQAISNGDHILLTFQGLRSIESVDIVATNLVDYADFSMEVSTDNVTFTPLDNQASCTSYSLTASGYGCQFTTNQDVIYFRLKILNNLNTPQIHEIVLMGTAPLA